MYAASHGNYGPVVAAVLAVLAVIVAICGGLDAFGLVTRLSRWFTARDAHVESDLDPFSVGHLRFVLGIGSLIIAAGLVFLT